MSAHNQHIDHNEEEYSHKRMILEFIVLLLLFLIVLSLIGYS